MIVSATGPGRPAASARIEEGSLVVRLDDPCRPGWRAAVRISLEELIVLLMQAAPPARPAAALTEAERWATGAFGDEPARPRRLPECY